MDIVPMYTALFYHEEPQQVSAISNGKVVAVF